MKSAEYLDQILVRYASTFDLYQPYVIHGKEYPAYGYFSSHIEKYVLVREANMWSSDSYEHILFIETEEITEALLEEAYQIIREYMEPVLVRKGEKLPAQNHMYSYLTVAVLSEKAISKQIKKEVRKFRFEKSYQFSLRGFSQGHLICAAMETEEVYSNYTARQSAKIFKDIFKKG